MAMIRNQEKFTFVAAEYDCAHPFTRNPWITEELDHGLILFETEAGANDFARDLVKTASNEAWPGQRSGRIPLLVDVYVDDNGKWVVYWVDSLKE